MVPLVVLVVAGLLAGVVIFQDLGGIAEVRRLVQEEDRLGLRSTAEHVRDYFDAVYSTLLFISLDDAVKGMRSTSRDCIQKLYDYQHEHDRLTEIMVVARDFSETGPPVMVFEQQAAHPPPDQTHTAEREKSEYRALKEQVLQFEASPSLRAALSQQLPLCVADAQGGMAPGFVYSVPIRSDLELVGAVAGMIKTQTIRDVLRRGRSHRIAFLISERGDWIGPEGTASDARRWFEQEFRAQGVASFLAHAGESFPVGHWVALWTPAKILSTENWWVVLLSDQHERLRRPWLAGRRGHEALAASLLVAGAALALLVRILSLRLAEQARHLGERRQLEQLVQNASEREQRRIGERLREDLCQRLTGIEAVGKALEKKLGGARRAEARVVAEMATEIEESLARALEMADELQPVALLQGGFLAAVSKLAENTEKRHGLPCRLDAADFPEELEISMATHLYRIAQEALANAVQHARATQVQISLTAERDRITLTITDDGVGLPPDAAHKSGMGLRIMRYRSDLLGAQLEILPAPDHGTLVRCTCPKS